MSHKMTFTVLRQLLESLGFQTNRKQTHVLFKHTPSDTVIVLRSYSPREVVSARELDVVQTTLDHRGLMEARTFHQTLQDVPRLRESKTTGTPERGSP